MISKEERFEIFLKSARLKHGNKFDYSLVEYINASTKVKIICPIHGVFERTPNQHIQYDCGKCKGMHKTTEDIIKQFEEVHGKKYDYSLVEYKNDSSKVEIICPTHGIFKQQVACHLRQKQGCPKCGTNRVAELSYLGEDKFIERIENIFGNDSFDYILLKYKNANTPVSLICKKCGNIETKSPSDFYRGFGCLVCKGDKVGRKSMTQEIFLERVKTIHGDKYDYSETIFTEYKSKIKIICPKHGAFEQVVNDHIQGCGCPSCRTSKGEERIIRFLKENNINYIFQHQVRINNSYHYYDFYLEDYNLVIEFNGMQHYKPIKFFGGEEGFEYLKKRDEIKKQYCLENQIDLFIISYKENIENKLLKKLNIL